MSRIAVFGYGSLVNPESAARTLGREPSFEAARLLGWRRRWSLVRDNLASEKTFARQPDGELFPWALGLNLEPDEDGDPELAPNGALLEMSEEEVERLDLRELRYDRVEVTNQISGAAGFEQVYSYRAKPEHFAARPPDECVIVGNYLRVIESGFRNLGEGQWELFLETTGPPPVEPIEVVLVRDEIPPGNPRDW